jgi:hypothetical protein
MRAATPSLPPFVNDDSLLLLLLLLRQRCCVSFEVVCWCARERKQ